MKIFQAPLLFAAGLVIGFFHFGLLWLTVSALESARAPALRVAGSFFLRTAVCLAAFCLVMQGNWNRLLPAMVGFLAVRTVLLKSLGTGRRGAEE